MSQTGDIDAWIHAGGPAPELRQSEHVSLPVAWIRWAGELEVFSPKPGNVYLGAPLRDLTAAMFLTAAVASAKPLAAASRDGIGAASLAAVRVVRNVLPTNVNLGIVLAIAPLAAVRAEIRDEPGLRDEVVRQLRQTTIADSAAVFEAIRIAEPGGLGDAEDQDVRSVPTLPLRDVMALAADRDQIAQLYATDYEFLWSTALPLWRNWRDRPRSAELSEAWWLPVTALALEIHARCPDTLIVRKYGLQVGAECSARAGEVLAAGWPDSRDGWQKLMALDRWYRSQRYNPGTTADLVALTLYAALRLDEWSPRS